MKKSMFAKEYAWRGLMTAGGLFVIVLTICIGAFLVYKGSGTFTTFHHTLWEFLGSAEWNPTDGAEGGGAVGALIFIVGSLATCGLALLIATPFALGSAIFMIEISPKFGEKFYRPIVEIFAGIPSVVYGWVGLSILVPAIKTVFNRQVGHSVLAAGLVLAVMIFPDDHECGSGFHSFRTEGLPYGSIRARVDQMAGDLQGGPSGGGTGNLFRNHPGTCKSVRRSSRSGNGDRTDHRTAGKHSVNNEDSDNRDRFADGKCNGRRRNEDGTLDDGASSVPAFAVVHFPDPFSFT